MTIELSKEDYDFLKELQHELNIQDNDGTADPLYWMVMEKRKVVALDGEYRIPFDDGSYTLEELIQLIEENIQDYDKDIQEEWKTEIDRDDAYDVAYFANDRLGFDNIYYDYIYCVQEENHISKFSGAFLTKRACQKHIETNKHHYNQPHTYAMCAYRNPEYEKLLKILKTMKLED